MSTEHVWGPGQSSPSALGSALGSAGTMTLCQQEAPGRGGGKVSDPWRSLGMADLSTGGRTSPTSLQALLSPNWRGERLEREVGEVSGVNSAGTGARILCADGIPNSEMCLQIAQ